MPEIVRAALVQQAWAGDKDSMIAAAAAHIATAASAGAQVVCLQELFYGPYFCQVQDADYYGYTEAIPDGPTTRLMQALARQHHIVIIAADVRGGAARAVLQHRRGHRRRRPLPRQVPQEPPPAGQGVLGEVLLPPGQPRLPGLRHRRRPDRRLHLLRPALPGGLAGARPGRRADRVQPLGDLARALVLPVEARAARGRGRQRVLRRRDQPGRASSRSATTTSTASPTSSTRAASSSATPPPTTPTRWSCATSTWTS